MINYSLLIQPALRIEAEIPALRVCEAICSTDCHAPLVMTDCSEKPDPQGNAQIFIVLNIQHFLGGFNCGYRLV